MEDRTAGDSHHPQPAVHTEETASGGNPSHSNLKRQQRKQRKRQTEKSSHPASKRVFNMEIVYFTIFSILCISGCDGYKTLFTPIIPHAQNVTTNCFMCPRTTTKKHTTTQHTTHPTTHRTTTHHTTHPTTPITTTQHTTHPTTPITTTQHTTHPTTHNTTTQHTTHHTSHPRTHNTTTQHTTYPTTHNTTTHPTTHNTTTQHTTYTTTHNTTTHPTTHNTTTQHTTHPATHNTTRQHTTHLSTHYTTSHTSTPHTTTHHTTNSTQQPTAVPSPPDFIVNGSAGICLRITAFLEIKFNLTKEEVIQIPPPPATNVSGYCSEDHVNVTLCIPNLQLTLTFTKDKKFFFLEAVDIHVHIKEGKITSSVTEKDMVTPLGHSYTCHQFSVDFLKTALRLEATNITAQAFDLQGGHYGTASPPPTPPSASPPPASLPPTPLSASPPPPTLSFPPPPSASPAPTTSPHHPQHHHPPPSPPTTLKSQSQE
ncbi:macrosialin-like isoform X1 [Pelobates cultripes]|uniref:Macrosialin-like isoform X1 n=2 Tax=Pelobates cultripes TaxID=61616 RepID=A0AAD1VW20_PELCU|nr:macrosialin-like isoform X1 [Pelobates cultripes]